MTLATPVADLDDPRLYVNQELSWLKFNDRVLDEARNQTLPLLERVRFLSIYANNLDEFFMVRVSGLRDQAAGGVVEIPPDGMSPTQQLASIREVLGDQLTTMQYLWRKDLLPGSVKRHRDGTCHDLDPSQKSACAASSPKRFFLLTPLARRRTFHIQPQPQPCGRCTTRCRAALCSRQGADTFPPVPMMGALAAPTCRNAHGRFQSARGPGRVNLDMLFR